jgi:hypothetical protein
VPDGKTGLGFSRGSGLDLSIPDGQRTLHRTQGIGWIRIAIAQVIRNGASVFKPNRCLVLLAGVSNNQRIFCFATHPEFAGFRHWRKK